MILALLGEIAPEIDPAAIDPATDLREAIDSDSMDFLNLTIHPDDAEREGVHDGELVTLESRWGVIRVAARRSPRVRPGTLFLAFHQPDTHANRIVGPHADPLSKCPSYEVTAVRIVASRVAPARR